MDNLNTNILPSGQVTEKPDKSERSDIRKKYNLTAFVIIMNIVIFNYISRAVIYGIASLSSMSIDINEIHNSVVKMMDNYLISIICSVGIPICSETFAILLGSRILKLNIKELFTFTGFNGKSVCKLATVSLGLQAASAVVGALIAEILKNFNLQIITPEFTPQDTAFLPNFILYMYICIIGPVLEELLYRGVLLQSLKKYNNTFAIVVSALIFGMMHQNIFQCILGISIGIPLAMLTLKSDSIVPAIFTHIIVNTSASVISLLFLSDGGTVYQKMLENKVVPTSGLPLVGLIIAFIWRFGFLIAGGIVGIVGLVKGFGLKKPTLAGKSRSWPVLFTCVLWYLVFAFYIYQNTFGCIGKIE